MLLLNVLVIKIDKNVEFYLFTNDSQQHKGLNK